MNRASILIRSISAHRKKILLASGTAIAGGGGGGYFWDDDCYLEDQAALFSQRLDDEKTVVSYKGLLSSAVTDCKASIPKEPIPSTTPIPSRSEQLNRLQQSNQKEPFDVLVIGGGATGAGAALDAATRGLSVAMIDRADFGNETSSRSTKLIWAGIRYIATATSALLRFHNITRPREAVSDFIGEFQMVLGAHKERKIMLENNPRKQEQHYYYIELSLRTAC
eukprot:scaffold22589_cov138-Cylindrotheca_fusiformis.AAC.12